MIPEQIPVKNHWGNNSATVFSFDFYIENEEQLKVTHTDFDGNETVLTYGVDYSIEEFNNINGSSITFPLEDSTFGVLGWDTRTGEKELLSIALDLPIEQPAEYDMSGELNKKNLEKSFDYLTRLLQINQRVLSRTFQVPEGLDITIQEYINDLYHEQIYHCIAEKIGNIQTSGSITTSYDNEVLSIVNATFEYEQAVASDEWIINHDLNKYPSVTVVDSSGNVIEPAVSYTDRNTCVVEFLGATTGKAYLN